MNWNLIFVIIIMLVLLRVLWLHIKALNAKTEAFKVLSPKDKLAVLKECLLNSPAEYNLQNLVEFCKEHQIEKDFDSYRPFFARQLELSKKKDAIAEDNELFGEEAAWIDQISPLEFKDAEEARANGDKELALKRTLEGISRLYSDQAIENELKKMENYYPKSIKLLENYKKLAKVRDESGADDKSLEKLRKQRDNWQEDLLTIE